MGLLFCAPSAVSAQTVEVAPLGGYRFGGDFFELAAEARVDRDGAPSLGAVFNIEMWDGLWFEALFTHQQADVDVRDDLFGPPARVRAVVDHWLAGGRQDLGSGRVRPFLTGLVGLTRYAAEDEDEVRFAVAAGGGVSLMPHRRIGLRLDGRVFTTFVEADARAVGCGAVTCLVGFNLNVVWQAEVTTGVVLVF
jgi:hypothetical protein